MNEADGAAGKDGGQKGKGIDHERREALTRLAKSTASPAGSAHIGGRLEGCNPRERRGRRLANTVTQRAANHQRAYANIAECRGCSSGRRIKGAWPRRYSRTGYADSDSPSG